MGWRKIDKNKRYSKEELYRRAHIGMGQTKACEKVFWDYVEEKNIEYCWSGYPAKYMSDFISNIQNNCFNSLHLIDHKRIYKTSFGKIFLVSQPYSDYNTIIDDEKFGQYRNKTDVNFMVDDKGSWYYPNRCCLIEFDLN